MRKLVIIPTYNEKENIQEIIQTVIKEAPDFDILVMDDSSPDGTAQLVQEMQNQYPNTVHLIVRQNKEGLGKAYIEGFKWALDKCYDAIFEMDADFSHNPKDLNRLAESLENGADVAVGSRYSHGVNVVNWPMNRVLLSYGGSKYVKFITQLPVADPTAGFVGYRAEVLQSISLDKIKFKGYGFQIEMKYRAWQKNYKIEEVPIIFTDRKKGESKISSNIIWEAVFGVIGLKFKSITGRL